MEKLWKNYIEDNIKRKETILSLKTKENQK